MFARKRFELFSLRIIAAFFPRENRLEQKETFRVFFSRYDTRFRRWPDGRTKSVVTTEKRKIVGRKPGLIDRRLDYSFLSIPLFVPQHSIKKLADRK